MIDERHTATLKGAGLRVTAPRLATLAAVTDRPHATAETATAAVRERLGSVSTQAVYDVLNTLTDAGILRRISLDGRTARYEPETGDNHHHLVCRQCGLVEDAPCPVGEAPCMTPPGGQRGFAIDTAEVIYRGLCAQCQ